MKNQAEGIVVNLMKSGVFRNISNIGLILCRTKNDATLILGSSPTEAELEDMVKKEILTKLEFN